MKNLVSEFRAAAALFKAREMDYVFCTCVPARHQYLLGLSSFYRLFLGYHWVFFEENPNRVQLWKRRTFIAEIKFTFNGGSEINSMSASFKRKL